ncbi:hypothetical protein MBLNU459_g0369t1 [Dothideomycetes sp. NU459]
MDDFDIDVMELGPEYLSPPLPLRCLVIDSGSSAYSSPVKTCDWNYRWKFDDLSLRTQKKHRNVKVEGSPAWDEKAQRPRQMRKSSPNERNLALFAELLHDGEREEMAISKPAGTFNVILTQDSFHRLPQYGKIVKKQRRVKSKTSSPTNDGSPASSSDEDPDVVFLSDFEETPFVPALPSSTMISPGRVRQTIEFTAQVSCVSSVTRDITDYGLRDQKNFTLHYSGFISKRIMPLGSRFSLGGSSEDAVVVASREFRPLHHAICAISMLSVALKGQRNLLAGAFQHYHQAISACMSATNISRGQLLYLHFILLLYDIVCATQAGSRDERMVEQHLHHLARIAYAGDAWNPNQLQAYLLWYILFLDSSSCLAGNRECGGFVRAYLTNGSTLPNWRMTQTIHQKKVLGDDFGVFTAVKECSSTMCSQYALLSQLAVRMRTEAEGAVGSIASRQKDVSDFHDDMQRTWNAKYPTFLPRDSTTAGDKLPVLARTVFDFALLQHSTAVVYLHTSMYPKQRLHSHLHQKEVARHCSIILELASATVAAKNFDQHHFIFSLFLAGFASVKQRDKVLAVELLRAMEGTGISQNVSHSRKLLELVCLEQRARVAAGGCQEEVDWISFARERGMGFVNFGL